MHAYIFYNEIRTSGLVVKLFLEVLYSLYRKRQIKIKMGILEDE